MKHQSQNPAVCYEATDAIDAQLTAHDEKCDEYKKFVENRTRGEEWRMHWARMQRRKKMRKQRILFGVEKKSEVVGVVSGGRNRKGRGQIMAGAAGRRVEGLMEGGRCDCFRGRRETRKAIKREGGRDGK